MKTHDDNNEKKVYKKSQEQPFDFSLDPFIAAPIDLDDPKTDLSIDVSAADIQSYEDNNRYEPTESSEYTQNITLDSQEDAYKKSLEDFSRKYAEKQDANPTTYFEAGNFETKTKTNKKYTWMLIGIAAVIIILVVAIIAMVVNIFKDDPIDPSTPISSVPSTSESENIDVVYKDYPEIVLPESPDRKSVV